MIDISYEDALKNKEHLIALGNTEIWLRWDLKEYPWDKVCRVEDGNTIRLGGPSGANMIAHVDGLTFRWSVDFEGRDANGRSVSYFDRDRLRDVMRKLSRPARASFGNMLATKVLPKMQERTQEIRDALNIQQDSEDCVRGLIEFARDKQEATRPMTVREPQMFGDS